MKRGGWVWVLDEETPSPPSLFCRPDELQWKYPEAELSDPHLLDSSHYDDGHTFGWPHKTTREVTGSGWKTLCSPTNHPDLAEIIDTIEQELNAQARHITLDGGAGQQSPGGGQPSPGGGLPEEAFQTAWDQQNGTFHVCVYVNGPAGWWLRLGVRARGPAGEISVGD